MGSKTKIVVLHMKEIIYTIIFAALAILLIVLLTVMFRNDADEGSSVPDSRKYTPGTYTSTLTLNNANLEVEVSVDESQINSIRFSNLDESVSTMLPLIQPAMEEIAQQVYETQSLDNISLPEESPYTSQVILNAISEAVEKAAAN